MSYTDIIVTWMLDTRLSHIHTLLLHMLTARVYMYVLFLSCCHMNHHSYYMYYCSMLSPYSCYMIVSHYWYCYSCYWIHEMLICYVWTLISIVLVSRYLVICYQQSSCPVIMLHVPCIVFVLATLYTWNIIKITWGWGRLDGWLDLIGWMYWIHIVSPTAGDDSAAYRLYTSMSSRYLIRASLLAESSGLSSQGCV